MEIRSIERMGDLLMASRNDMKKKQEMASYILQLLGLHPIGKSG